jgi:Tol biopolymer transport system component
MRSSRILATSLAVVLVMAACSGGSGSRQSHDRQAPATSASEASVPRSGGGSISLSSLSGRIVFDNHDDVWVINADGTDLTRLTHSEWPEFDPSWSPDGTRIAFRSERSGEPEIWVMNADGTNQRRLTDGLSPAWSPDGSRIAYASPGDLPCPPGRGPRCSGLSIMNADGSGRHRLPHTEGGEYPSWSPDGTRIAFNSNLTGDHVMYVARADGSKVVDLSSVGEGWQVDWSPDGRFILFTSHRDHTDSYTDVYVMRPDGSGIHRLTNQRAYTPAWSPDGEHIVFSAPGLFVMDPDGTGVTALPTDVGETSLPDWTE